MSTFSGPLLEFPDIRIDNFTVSAPLLPIPSRQQSARSAPPALATFLSHIHTDHLRGLQTHRSPFVYCTPTTRALLLRLERRAHRLNFAAGVLETRTRTYAHLRRVLRAIPLDVPTEVELGAGRSVRVTAIDANHCPGACMFLVESCLPPPSDPADTRPGSSSSDSHNNNNNRRTAVLYTGDIRAEQTWLAALTAHPVLGPYLASPDGRTPPLRSLDNLYLDTSFAVSPLRGDNGQLGRQWWSFEPKGDGVRELLAKVQGWEDKAGPGRTRYYLHAWTSGYEDVLVALSAFLGSRVHVDEYRWRLYQGLLEGETRDVSQAARLVGFREGNRWQEGCLTREDGGEVRIHACERGMGCEVLKDENLVRIMPIVTRYKGVEYMEAGWGGGNGDLDQVHELELHDLNTVGALAELCQHRLQHRPDVLQKVTAWLDGCVKQGAANVRLDAQVFYDALGDEDGGGGGSQTNDLEDVPIEKLVLAIEKLVCEKKDPRLGGGGADVAPGRSIRFPYSRHSSLEELRSLMGRLRPKAVYPSVYFPGLDMDELFGDLLLDAKPGVEFVSPTADDDDDESVKTGPATREPVMLGAAPWQPRPDHQRTRDIGLLGPSSPPPASKSSPRGNADDYDDMIKTGPTTVDPVIRDDAAAGSQPRPDQEAKREIGPGPSAPPSATPSSPVHTSSATLSNPPVNETDAPSHRRPLSRSGKRRRRVQETSVRRRLAVYGSVLSSGDGEFRGLDLVSVSGYHNEEREVEL